jgi:hypothetical protein
MCRSRNFMKKPKFLLLLIFLCACVPVMQSRAPVYAEYLPYISKEAVIYGVENEGADWLGYEGMYPGMLLKVSVHQARENWIQGVYNWEGLDRRTSGHSGMLLVSLRGSASWANGGQAVCKLPLPIFYPQYLAYVGAVIEHSGADMIEVWNEPDTEYEGAAMYYGCVGESYAAGVGYAIFANMVSDFIHLRYPGVTVLVGALMNPYDKFTRGFLSLPVHADWVSVHYYANCGVPSGLAGVIQKVDSLTEKPIGLSETSLIYDEDSPECEAEQGQYAKDVRAMSGVKIAVWYGGSYNGWRHSDLVDRDGRQKSAFKSWVR